MWFLNWLNPVKILFVIMSLGISGLTAYSAWLHTKNESIKNELTTTQTQLKSAQALYKYQIDKSQRDTLTIESFKNQIESITEEYNNVAIENEKNKAHINHMSRIHSSFVCAISKPRAMAAVPYATARTNENANTSKFRVPTESGVEYYSVPTDVINYINKRFEIGDANTEQLIYLINYINDEALHYKNM